MRSAKQTPRATKPAKAQTEEAQATQPAGGQDGEALLKADHRAAEALFKKYEGETSATRKAEIVKEICTQLIVHSTIEEEIFYPACREKKVEDRALDEAQVEHDGAKILIADLTAETPEEEYYDAKVTVLSEYIKHHVGEEEKPSDGIFAKARTAGVDMNALGQRLKARKEELMAKAEAGSLRPPMPRSLQFRGQPPKRQEYETVDRRSQYRERDDQGRFAGDDDHDRGYSRGSSGRFQSRERDDRGRFMGDDDDRRYSRGRSAGRRDDDEDDRRGYASRGRSHGGWHGDPEGHSEASQRGWEERESRGGRRYADDDDDGRRGSSGGRGHGGWYGDSEGHSEASQRGWEHRGGGQGGRRYEDNNDNGRRGSSSRGGGHGGWFGDPEGHADASRRGWHNRD